MKKIFQNSFLPVCIAVATIGFFVSCDSGKTTQESSTETEQSSSTMENQSDFKISLAQWSLHRTFFGGDIEDWGWFGKMLRESPDSLLRGEDPMNFPKMAADYGIHSIELVNTFYFSKVDDMEYWTAFKNKCDELDVNVGLIMCDALGNLGDADPEARKNAAELHHKWIDVAEFLGAHSIRVNAAGQGTAEEVAANAVDGLSQLAEYAATKGINVIVENHGGYSSDAQWLASVMENVGKTNVGTLPDFGNFCIENGPDGCVKEYDRYKGIGELMPYAKGVSAKSHEFDEVGNEVSSDFLKIMKIVKDSGFRGYVGIEYEGSTLSEDEGIKATKALLDKVFAEV